jgi:hypothetical protein
MADATVPTTGDRPALRGGKQLDRFQAAKHSRDRRAASVEAAEPATRTRSMLTSTAGLRLQPIAAVCRSASARTWSAMLRRRPWLALGQSSGLSLALARNRRTPSARPNGVPGFWQALCPALPHRGRSPRSGRELIAAHRFQVLVNGVWR